MKIIKGMEPCSFSRLFYFYFLLKLIFLVDDPLMQWTELGPTIGHFTSSIREFQAGPSKNCTSFFLAYFIFWRRSTNNFLTS